MDSFHSRSCYQPNVKPSKQFSDLPVEIRLNIWELAVPSGRVLRFGIDLEGSKYQVSGPFSRVPTILHICQESRRLGLRHFCLGFPGLMAERHELYWSPQADTIYALPINKISWKECQSDPSIFHDLLKALPKVQHLALYLDRTGLDCFGKSWLQEGLQKLTNLRELTLVAHPFHCFFGEDMSFVLDEALDVPVSRLYSSTSAKIKRDIVSYLETSTTVDLPRQWPPAVEFAILCPKKKKLSGFCIPQSSTKSQPGL